MSSYLAGLLFLDVMACKKVEQECLRELIRIQDRLLDLQMQQEEQTARIDLKQQARDRMREQAARYVADRRQTLYRSQPGEATSKTRVVNQRALAPSPVRRVKGSTAAVDAERYPESEKTKDTAATRRDTAIPEVSLKVKKQEDLQQQEWQTFSSRVQRLQESKDPAIRRCADQLEQERKRCVPMGRKIFLQAQGQRIAALEEKEKIFCKKQADQREQILRYRALCKLLEQQPDPVVLADVDLCRRQAEEMWKQFSQCRQHTFMVQQLREVFAAHGIPVQAAQEYDYDAVSLCPLGQNAHLVVTHHSGGAFEMEVEGVCAGQEPTDDEMLEVLEQAVAFCRLYPKIEKDLAERGIHLVNHISREPKNLRFQSSTELAQDRFDTAEARQRQEE